MPRRPRLLFIVNDTGFFVSHRLPLARAAVAAGYAVHLLALDTGGRAELADSGVVLHPLPIDRTGTNPLGEARLLLAVLATLRRLGPDLVHTVTIKPVLYGAVAARLCRVPALVSAVSGLGYAFEQSGSAGRLLRRAVSLAYRAALRHPHSQVIFQNEADRGLFLAERLVAPERTTLIQGSGVDLDTFAPAPEPAGPLRVLFPARLLHAKGVAEFVQAAAAVRRCRPDVRFSLCGERPAHNRDSVAAGVLQGWLAEGAVGWLGHQAAMAEIYRGSHIVCLPSYREGLPKALLEAAACGRPIVTTDVPGCRDVVLHGENGLLVPARDHSALVAAIMALLYDPALRARFGAAGRLRAEAHFGLDAVVAATLRVYDRLLCGLPARQGQPAQPLGQPS